MLRLVLGDLESGSGYDLARAVGYTFRKSLKYCRGMRVPYGAFGNLAMRSRAKSIAIYAKVSLHTSSTVFTLPHCSMFANCTEASERGCLVNKGTNAMQKCNSRPLTAAFASLGHLARV